MFSTRQISINFLLLILTFSLYKFSVCDSSDEIAILKELTLDLRTKLVDGVEKVIDLLDFLISKEGREFLKDNNIISSIEKGLEIVYKRQKICDIGLELVSKDDTEEWDIIDCFCDDDDSIIYCLALASDVGLFSYNTIFNNFFYLSF